MTYLLLLRLSSGLGIEVAMQARLRGSDGRFVLDNPDEQIGSVSLHDRSIVLHNEAQ